MENPYDIGFNDGYCGNIPKFKANDPNSSFVSDYAKGFRNGQGFRDKIEDQIEKQYKSEDREMHRILNQRNIKF